MSILEDLHSIADKVATGLVIAKHNGNPEMLEGGSPVYQEYYFQVAFHLSLLSAGVKPMLTAKPLDAVDMFISIYTSRSPLIVQRLLMALFGLEFSCESYSQNMFDIVFKNFENDVKLEIEICDPTIEDADNHFAQVTYSPSVTTDDGRHILPETTSSVAIIELCKGMAEMGAEQLAEYATANAVELV